MPRRIPVADVPLLMKQWNFEKNKDIDIYTTPSQSELVVWWKCPDCGHEWQGKIVHKKKNKTECPRCNGVKYQKNILDVAPDIVKYYDYDYPDNPKLETLKPASRVVVHWKCPDCGNTWEQPLRHRYTRYGDEFTVRGCGFCNKKSVRLNYEEKYPELAKMYSSKNEIPFKDLKLKDGVIELIWVCDKCGCEFFKRLDYMLKYTDNEYNGCPACSGKRIAGPTNNFAVLHPDLMKEYSPDNDIDPYKVMPSSNKTVKWVCSEGHEWEASFQLRHDGYGKCPICNNIRMPKKGYNTLQDVFMDRIKEFSPNNEREPSRILADSGKAYLWICNDCGNEFSARVDEYIAGTAKCPYCNESLPIVGENSLFDKNILARDLWDYEKNVGSPERIFYDSTAAHYWKCSENHSFKMTPKRILEYGERGIEPCPICGNRVIASGENSFAALYPELLKDWDESNEIDPDTISINYQYAITWNCAEGHKYSRIIKLRIQDLENNEESCPYCADKKVWPGLNSFKVKRPDLMDSWDYEKNLENDIDPDRISIKFKLPVYWKCEEGHSYSMGIDWRMMYADENLTACPYCDDRKILSGVNSFQVKYPKLMEEWDWVSNYILVNPDEVSDSSNEIAWWNCPEGHTYKMQIHRRIMFDYRNMTACPYCKGLNKKKCHIHRKAK